MTGPERFRRLPLRPQVQREAVAPRRIRALSGPPPAPLPPVPILGAAPSPAPCPGNAVVSRWVGRFRRSPALAACPAQVRKGAVLGSVRALGVTWELRASCDTEVISVLVADDDVVEYGQPVVLLKPQA